MPYKHKVVQGLADILNEFGGGGSDPMMKAVWFGIRGQVPLILSQLDNAPDAVALIEAKMRVVLDMPPVALVKVEPEPEPKDITTQIIEASKPEPSEVPMSEVHQEISKPKKAKRKKRGNKKH